MAFSAVARPRSGPADPCASGGFRGAFRCGDPGLSVQLNFYGAHRNRVIGDHRRQCLLKLLKLKGFDWLPSTVICGDGKGDVSVSH